MEEATGAAPKPLRRSQARRRDLLERARAYAQGPLLRRLRATGQPVSIASALHGERSLVYFLTVGGQPPAVLRAVGRWSDAWKLLYNLLDMAAWRLPVPKLLTWDCTLRTRLRWGFYALVEERVEGRHIEALGRPEHAVRAVARTLAQFHNLVRERWGWPRFPLWGSYRRYYLMRIARRAGALDGMLKRRGSGDLMAWFRDRAAGAPLEAPFSLTHSRVDSTNFVITPGGEAVALDLLECRFGTFASDVAWALERICKGRAEHVGWFLDTYFALRPRPCREAFEASRAFFAADYRLARASIYLRRLPDPARGGDRREKRLSALRAHLARLAGLTGIDLAVKEP